MGLTIKGLDGILLIEISTQSDRVLTRGDRYVFGRQKKTYFKIYYR